MRKIYKFIPMLLGVFLMLGNPLFSSGQSLKSTLDITELPFSENWDSEPDPNAQWTYYTNSTEGFVTVQSSTYHSPDSAVDISNSTDETSDYFLVFPGTTLDPAGTRLKLFAKATTTLLSQQSFKVGILTDPNDPGTYTNLYNSNDLTDNWQEVLVDLSIIPPQTGTYYIAIQPVFDGTSKHLFIDDVVWEETPTGPVFQSTPNEYDFGTTMINTSSDEVDFVMTNYGIGTLNVSDITINGVDAADFTITNTTETLPFDLTANSANTITVTVQFAPTTEGVKNASIDVTANTEVNSIPLTGDCFDPTIYTLPWSENFDGVETPDLPMGWSSIFSAANTYAYYETATGGFSEPNCLKAYNSSDTEPVMLSITPPTAIDISTTRLQFMAKGLDGVLTIGTMTDHTDEATFDSITSITATSNWEEYIIDLDAVTPIAGTYFIALKAEFDYTYDYLYLDDITWMEIPTTPVAQVNPDTYEFPLIPAGQSTNSGTVFNLRNMGVGSLSVTTISGLDGTEFSITDIDFDTVAIDALDTRNFGVQYSPTTEGTHTATMSIETNGGTVDLTLTGNAYTLPDGMIEIGWEDETGQNLPMENFYRYSYSQSLFTQEEINVSNSKITSIFYHKNDSEDWPEAAQIDIYIGHTSQDTISDWIPLSELEHVTFSETLPVSDAEGWVEFVLDDSFIYNNVDNLVVAFDENQDGAYGSGTDEFYCHNTDHYMSARYYNDGTNPDPASPPTISSTTGNPGLKKFRPNIRMQFEDVPATPTAVLDPEVWDAGQRPIGYTAISDTYTLTNMGSDPLTVTAITDLSGTPFSTSFVAGDVVDLPLAIDYEFTFEFTPTTEGTYETEFIVEVNGTNDTIMLYGSCDYSLPANIVEIGWANDTVDLPMDPASVYTYSQSVYEQTEIDMPDQAIYSIYYHQNSAADLSTENIKVYMAHYAENNLDANWANVGDLVEVYDGPMGTQDAEGWVEITLDIPFIYNNTDNLLVAFDENGAASFTAADGFYGHSTNENAARVYTSDFTDVDPGSVSGGDLLTQRPNIRIEFGDLPTDPIFSLNMDSWDAGMVPGNQSASSGDIFRITNLGAGTLTLTNAMLLDGSVFSTSLVSGDVSLTAAEEYEFNFTFAPLEVGTFHDTLVITHADGTDSIYLTGSTDYVLPEHLVEIGNGTEDYSLPIEAYYGYTYSQTIYLQTEINKENMRISKIYYQKNNDDEWDDNGQIKIYMGHTTQESLTDWIPLAQLNEVHYEELLPLGDEYGWVEFTLTTPFIYNNVDNLVIAVDENMPSYSSYGDYFYCESAESDMSIRYYSDGTNPDPASPPSGTLVSGRPNTRLQFEELPTTPIFSVMPDSHDFGTTLFGMDDTTSVTVQNNGINVLTISDIYLGGDDASEFAINNLPTFPIGITNDYADAFSINAIYSPTFEGDASAIIYFEHSEGLDSVMLYGNGYDATITSIPWNEYFDDPATTLYPDMTLGWNTILETTNTYADIKVYNYTYLTEPYCVRFYNSGDNDPSSEYMLVTPRTQLDPTGTRLRFFADGSSGDQLIVGYMTDPTDATTFVQVETVDLQTDYTQHFVDLSSVTATGYYHFAFKANFAGTYHYIYLDNVTWETTPTTPVFEAMPTAVDFGSTLVADTVGPESIEIRNSGIGNLIITDVELIGTHADQFLIEVMEDLNDTISVDYSDFLTVEAKFAPTSLGYKTADIQFTDVDMNTYTVPLIGNVIDATMVPDTLIDFEDAVPPMFWERFTGLLDNDPIELTETTLGWTADDFANDASFTQAARCNIWSTTDDWMVTSSIDLGDGTNPVLIEFDLATTPYSGTGEAGDAPDDRFAVVISTDDGATWEAANVLRIWDNQGSDYVYDNIPNGEGEHTVISLSDYSGIVKLGFYGESTASNADNNLYIDDLIIRYFTPEELALLDAIDNTTMTASPEMTAFEETSTDEHAIDYSVDYPTPFDSNLDALLLHDFMVQFSTMIPNGTTIDIEFDGTNVGQYVADGTDSIFRVSDVAGTVNPALNTMADMDVTLKVNGLNTVGQYDITVHSLTAFDGEFDMPAARTLLANATASMNVIPTPIQLPIEEDFDGGIPENWIIDNNGTDGADWTFMTDSLLGSTTGDNGYMRVNDGDVSGLTNADLISYPIDMSSVTGTVMLEFEHRYDDISITTATVFVSSDNGTTWTQVEQYTNDQGTSMNDPIFESIDITDFAAGHSSVMIRWNYNDNGLDGLNWNIDDVHIYEYIPSSEAEILTFDITEQVSSTINSNAATVDVVMPYGTDLSALIPEFTLSEGAIANIDNNLQVSGTSQVDFTNSVETPIVYAVIAEDETTTKLWDVTVSTEVSIADAGQFNFAVYPNPSNGQFDLNVYSESGFTYSIYAMDGKLIHQAQIDASGAVTEIIDLKNIAPGVYTLKVNADNTIKVEKLVIE